VQIFAVACRPDGTARAHDVEAAVAGAAAAFPQLAGGERIVGQSSDGRLAFAALAHPTELAGPRRYSHRLGRLVTLVDGLPVHRDGSFDAYDASVLHEHWRGGPDALEGIFSALRIDLDLARVECLTDPIGMAKVFVANVGSGWLLSNSVDAIRRLGAIDAPDPLGVSALLSLGWPVGRTLVSGVEPLAGGSLHTLSTERHSQRPYLTAEMVAPRNNAHRLTDATELADRLRTTTAAAIDGLSDLSCPVTAGRDTRVLLALMLALGKREIDYYTSGVPGEPDVEIARMLAEHAGVAHRLVTPEVARDPVRWREITARFCAQTDGMATLHGISDHIDHGEGPAPLGLKMWGPGGEIARAGNIGMLIPFASQMPGLRSSWEVQKRTLETKTSGLDGVVRAEALEATRRHLREFADARRAEGWRSREVLEAYYAFERVRNWASTGVRRVSGATDVFSPYISRDFYEYAFSLSSGERYMEAAHYRLLTVLARDLRDLPFEKPWKPQRPGLAPLLAVRGVTDAMAARGRSKFAPRRGGRHTPVASTEPRDFGSAWFEAGIEQHRELSASVPQSPLWDYVDRRRLEAVLAGTPEERKPHAEGLCGVLTAFWYFHGRTAAA
jgi:hypothetical protein